MTISRAIGKAENRQSASRGPRLPDLDLTVASVLSNRTLNTAGCEGGADIAQARLRINAGIDLSELEIRCLELYGAGMKRAEISAITRAAPRTVGATLTVAKEKLGARSLAHAAVLLRARTLARDE